MTGSPGIGPSPLSRRNASFNAPLLANPTSMMALQYGISLRDPRDHPNRAGAPIWLEGPMSQGFIIRSGTALLSRCEGRSRSVRQQRLRCRNISVACERCLAGAGAHLEPRDCLADLVKLQQRPSPRTEEPRLSRKTPYGVLLLGQLRPYADEVYHTQSLPYRCRALPLKALLHSLGGP